MFNDRMLPTLVLVNIVGTVGIVGIAARWRRRSRVWVLRWRVLGRSMVLGVVRLKKHKRKTYSI